MSLSFPTLSRPLGLDSRAGLAAILGLIAAPLIGLYVARSPTSTLATIGALVGAIVLVGRPHWAAYGVLFGVCHPNLGVDVGFAFLDLGDLASLALVPSWALGRLAGRGAPRLISTWWLVLAFLLWEYISLVAGGGSGTVTGRFARQAVLVLTAIAMMDLLADPDRLRRGLWIMAVSGGLEGLVAVPEFGSAYRVDGAMDQPNLFANICALSCLPALAISEITPRRAPRLLLQAIFGLLVLGVVLSISRGTYLALGITLLWWVRRSRRQLLAVLAVGVALGTLVPQLRERQSTDIADRLEMQDQSVTNRWVTIQNGLSAIAAHPFLGVGFGQYEKLDRQLEVTQQAGRSAHNYYLSITASSGLPALLILLLFFGSVFRGLWHWQKRNAGRREPEALEQAGLVHGVQALCLYMVLTILTKGMALPLWVAFGLGAAATRMPAPPPPPPPEPAPP